MVLSFPIFTIYNLFELVIFWLLIGIISFSPYISIFLYNTKNCINFKDKTVKISFGYYVCIAILSLIYVNYYFINIERMEWYTMFLFNLIYLIPVIFIIFLQKKWGDCLPK